MPRLPSVIRPTHLHLKLPETTRARVDLILFSELEGRVPQGMYQDLINTLLEAWLSEVEGGKPWIRGAPVTVQVRT
jgi:hypothetical protein